MSDIWIERRSTDSNGVDEKRTPYHRDYGRIVHSASFRRLQSKTQVLGLGESDFYRTRLTHSMEVAQIASGIRFHLEARAEGQAWKDFLPCDHLIQSIGLAHDLGHPPYGHAGEVALNYVMREHGGFEGNAQTLRILSRLEKYKVDDKGTSYGSDLTRRTLLGVIKYPCTYSAVNNPERYKNSGNDVALMKESQFKPPKCYYNEEKDVFDWVISPFSDADKALFQHSIKNIDKDDGSEADEYGFYHRKPEFKALDTSIMELADDISYSIHDLEDAISLGMVALEDWSETAKDLNGFEVNGLNAEKIGKELFSEASNRKQMISKLVNFFITSVNVELKYSCFSDPLLKYQAVLPQGVREHLDIIHKGLTVKKVIKDRNVQLLQFKGQMLVIKLFEALANDPKRFLPDSTYKLYEQPKGDGVVKLERVICDYVSGMTDAYATKLYEKLYIPNRGSVFDKL